MSLAHGPQAQDEAHAAFGRARLVRMRDDAGIEQRRGLERILMQEIRADQAALLLAEARVIGKGFFHFDGARLEGVEQVPMAALEIVEHVGELQCHRRRVERQHAIDDVVGAGLVGGIEVARFGRRLEGTHDAPATDRA